MKLLFVLPEYFPNANGGIATFYQELVRELVKEGNQVQIIVGSGVEVGGEPYTLDGASVEKLSAHTFKAYQSKFKKFSVFPEFQDHLAAAWAIFEQVHRGEQYDIIETTDWGFGYIPWVIEKKTPPVWVQLHASQGQIDYYDPREGLDLLSDFIRLVEISTLPLAEHLQTYSTSNQQMWSELLQRSIPCVAPAFEVRPDKHPETGKSSGMGLVVGRVQHWKGPAVLCEALRLMGKDAPEIMWVGRDVPYKKRHLSMGKFLQKTYPDIWGKKIIPQGAMPYKEVRDLQASCQFGIIPSIWDVFNFTCLELMSLAKPVICSDGAGAIDFIKDGENGFAFSAGDSHQLATKLSSLLALSSQDLHAISNKGKEAIEQMANPVKAVTQRMEVYQDMVKNKRSAQANRWLSKLLCPSDAKDNLFTMLDHKPLQELSKYLINRGFSKIKNTQ